MRKLKCNWKILKLKNKRSEQNKLPQTPTFHKGNHENHWNSPFSAKWYQNRLELAPSREKEDTCFARNIGSLSRTRSWSIMNRNRIAISPNYRRRNINRYLKKSRRGGQGGGHWWPPLSTWISCIFGSQIGARGIDMMYYNAVAVFFWISPQENRLKTEKIAKKRWTGGVTSDPPLSTSSCLFLILSYVPASVIRGYGNAVTVHNRPRACSG